MSRAVWALVRRDLTVVLRSRPLTIPLIVVPVILTVLIPLALTLVARAASGTPEGAAKAAQLLASLPPLLRERLAGLGLDQVPVVALTVYVLAPLFLILPMMVASVLAADSFAGERERKTLESLLYTPLTDGELLLAKTAVSFVPAVAVTFASFLVYALVVNVAAWPLMGRIFFPPPMWLVLIGWVAPGVALLGLAGTVVVSLRVKGVQEAMQLSGVLVLPIIGLIVAQLRGALLLGPGALAVIGLAVWALAAALLWYGARTFRRERLISNV